MLSPKVKNSWDRQLLEKVCAYFQQRCTILNSEKSYLQKRRYCRKIKSGLWPNLFWICDCIEESLPPRFLLPVRNMNEKLTRSKMEKLLFSKSLYSSGKPTSSNHRLKDALTDWAVASVRHEYNLSRTPWLQEAVKDEEWLRDFLELAFSIPASGIFFHRLTRDAFYAQTWCMGKVK